MIASILWIIASASSRVVDGSREIRSDFRGLAVVKKGGPPGFTAAH